MTIKGKRKFNLVGKKKSLSPYGEGQKGGRTLSRITLRSDIHSSKKKEGNKYSAACSGLTGECAPLRPEGGNTEPFGDPRPTITGCTGGSEADRTYDLEKKKELICSERKKKEWLLVGR